MNNTSEPKEQLKKRLKDINKIVQEVQNLQIIKNTFAQEARFKQNGFETIQQKGQYFAKNYKIIFCSFIVNCILSTKPQTRLDVFDEFSDAFYNWLTEDPLCQFPISRNQFYQMLTQKRYHQKKSQRSTQEEARRIQQQRRQQQLALQQKQKQKQRQQLQKQQRQKEQNQRLERQRIRKIQQKMQMQQRQKQKQKQEKKRRELKQQQDARINRLKMQKNAQIYKARKMEQAEFNRNNAGRPNIQRSPAQQLSRQPQYAANQIRTPQQGTSPRSTAQLNINPNLQKVQNKSPAHNQRFEGEQNRPFYNKPQPTKQEQIKKILAKICESCQHVEKRHKIYLQIKPQFQILKRIEDNQKIRR